MRAAFQVPLRRPFRGVSDREGVLLAGPCGWGEFSPFPDYPPERAALWLAAAREASSTPWPAPRRERIPVNVTVPAVEAEAAWDLVARSGCRTAKVKIAGPGHRAADDLARVEAVRDALGPDGALRVDVNAAWGVDDAVARLTELARFDLEYAEQPVATLDEMAALRRRVAVPLAVDESVRDLVAAGAADASTLARVAEAADVAVLKVAPLGGVWPALRIAEAVGLPVVVSSAVETSVGLAAGVALAAALPELDHACGLGTATMLARDVVAESLWPVDGTLAVRRPPVDPRALAACAPPPARAEELHARLTAAERAAVGR